jgi:hypothetical protein
VITWVTPKKISVFLEYSILLTNSKFKWKSFIKIYHKYSIAMQISCKFWQLWISTRMSKIKNVHQIIESPI